MSGVIMLAKQYNPAKLSFPVYVSEKLDGVAAEFYVPLDSPDGKVLVRSRQNKPILSVQHIIDELNLCLIHGEHVIGELYIADSSFKDISGKVRSHDPQPELKLMVYDVYEDGYELPYDQRLGDTVDIHYDNLYIIPTVKIQDINELNAYVKEFFTEQPEAEGLMIRSHDHMYQPGKRSWGMMKLKQRETVDLKIISIEEATDADGNPKGMAGRFNCAYKGAVIGVGPGKLSHAERTVALINRRKLVGTIVEVGYMPDPAYEALREPTVIRFRDDKNEPNEEVV